MLSYTMYAGSSHPFVHQDCLLVYNSCNNDVD